ncbi:MAG: DUF1016 family protein, partial [Oscillospiraceae bacterium]|nr:DUF1016 family protein [Oscillospiraceae bacterium]
MSGTFDNLVQNVEYIHGITSATAKSAINQMLTLRNWMIGYYIVEFEQHGKDRAEYGTHLLDNLSHEINIKGLGRVQLNLCRIFYQKYPQICSTASNRLKAIGGIREIPLLSDQIVREEICSTASNKFVTDPEVLVSKLSYSHIREIMVIDDPFERFFYEFECIRCGWSVKELRRQISTTLYFRAGISKNPEKLLEKTISGSTESLLSVKDPFAFEFLGLDAKETVEESDIEQALMDHLTDFLLEMGRGFCFEARQKRIIIDDEYYFIDLVLYNRILHCNVIIELKDDKFTH